MLTANTQISLFPLNVVLFPGMMLPLHIFEERYKKMIRACINSPDQIFGIILTRNQQAQAPDVSRVIVDDLHTIGTTARITAVEQLQNGRMNLITVGEEPFIIRNVQPTVEDYLIGNVDPFPVADSGDPVEIETLAQQLKPMVEEYIGYLATASGEDLSKTSLPTDAKALSYLAGAAIQGSLPDKQKLLSATSLRSLVSRAINVLDKENQIMAYMLNAHEVHRQVQRPPFVDYSLN